MFSLIVPYEGGLGMVATLGDLDYMEVHLEYIVVVVLSSFFMSILMKSFWTPSGILCNTVGFRDVSRVPPKLNF